jgi:hypothetical protein
VKSPQLIQRSGIFYGWLVVAAVFAVMFVGFGSAYTFSAFPEPMPWVAPPQISVPPML